TSVGFPKRNWKLGHVLRGGVIATRMYRVRSRYELTPLDEVRLAAVIQRTTTAET
ncbi:Bgt-20620-4, partial [Blumeria graminis f. sp. tritici]